MDADQRRKLRSRKPLSDLRNIDTRLSSQSSSSPTRTASKVKASKPKPSSAFNKSLNKSIKSSTADAPVNNVTTAPIDLNYAPPPSYSAPSTPTPSSSSRVPGNGDVDLWKISSVYSRRKTSDKSKTKGKAVQEPLIIMPMSEGKREDIGGSLGRTSKATSKKKQRRMPAEQGLPQDFIIKQRAYFNEIDLEPLSVEEIESDAELE